MKAKNLVIFAVVILFPSMASAQGPPDVQNATIFQGSVTIYGASASDGTSVTAMDGSTLRGFDDEGTSGGKYILQYCSRMRVRQ